MAPAQSSPLEEKNPPKAKVYPPENCSTKETPSLVTLLPRSFGVPRPLSCPRVSTSRVGCAPDTPALTRVVHEIGGGAGPEPVDPGPKPRRGCRTCLALASLSFGADSDRGCDESVMTRGRPSAS